MSLRPPTSTEHSAEFPQTKGLLSLLIPEAPPLDLQVLGRTLLHAAVVGAAAGVVGAAFFGALEYVQRFVLEYLAGYRPLRAHGETLFTGHRDVVFRPWLLVVLPAVGALACGLLSRICPEVEGGGGDAMIRAFHRHDGVVRARVIWAKALASICTLGTGGAGGREGPTMHIGGALGSTLARLLRVSARERRILLVAGVAAGISAVFRTPLGAALLAVEVLYRDDFETDALIPAVLSSVVAYSVVIALYGESTLFARAAGYPFVPAHLPYYALLALAVALLAIGFVNGLRIVKYLVSRVPGPRWLRPALGGLALGVVATPIIWLFGRLVGTPGQGLGLLGGGYGAVQMAITGAAWLPGGWQGVWLLFLLCGAKLVAASLTIGSGGSAGDFAPSLVLGGVFGGAFGRALQLLLHDPRVDPGAFALVGMAAFYGGIAHAPLSSLILVCELAGNYDLLVPLMLAEGIAFVALRKRTLYPAQPWTRRDSPVHKDAHRTDVLGTLLVRDKMIQGRLYVSFAPRTKAEEIVSKLPEATWQDVFPVEEQGTLRGMITADALRMLVLDRDVDKWTIAADIMVPPVTVRPDDSLRAATSILLQNGIRELPVVDPQGRIVGFLDEADIAKAYLEATPPPGVTTTQEPGRT
jgi:CIC family chloride channel protein